MLPITFMNNLMLHFSGVELSRLRTLVADVEKEVARGRSTDATAGTQTPRTALDMTWSRLVALLDLGAEPEMRECPKCKQLCMLGATRCNRCWTSLPAPMSKGERAA
jgi:hypothetical protein